MTLEVQIPECNACGACCGDGKPLWVEVTQEDGVRINNPTLIERGDIEPWAMKTVAPLHQCIAWSGCVGEKSHCTIYETRPEICRTLERGSPACIYMLGLHKLKVLRSHND